MAELRPMLERLGRAWADAGVPVAQLLPTGRNPADVREALSHIVERVPEDIVTWFAWHDGGPTSLALAMAPSRFLASSLQYALESRDDLGEWALQAATSFGDVLPVHYWEPTWLPIAEDGGGGYLVVDLASTDSTRTGTVYSVDWSNPDFRQPRFASLADVLPFWLEVLDLGLWRWNTAEQMWDDFDFNAVPERYRDDLVG